MRGLAVLFIALERSIKPEKPSSRLCFLRKIILRLRLQSGDRLRWRDMGADAELAILLIKGVFVRCALRAGARAGGTARRSGRR